MRAMRRPGPGRRKGAVWLVAALAMAVIAVVLTGRAAATRPSDDAVVAAAVAIPAGADLADAEWAGALVMAPVPEGLSLAGLLRDPAAVAGRRPVVPISPGEPVTEAALGGAPGTGPAPLRAGERAVSLGGAIGGASAAALRPGLRVDVIASSGEGIAGRSRVIVANAEVLAASAAGDDPVADGGVFLRVPARKVVPLTNALSFAHGVRIVIRPFAEDLAP